MKLKKCKHCILIQNVMAMDMKDCISLCEIAIYEVLVSQNVLRAEVSVHARCKGYESLSGSSMSSACSTSHSSRK